MYLPQMRPVPMFQLFCLSVVSLGRFSTMLLLQIVHLKLLPILELLHDLSYLVSVENHEKHVISSLGYNKRDYTKTKAAIVKLAGFFNQFFVLSLLSVFICLNVGCLL